jgi:hypothetical protein
LLLMNGLSKFALDLYTSSLPISSHLDIRMPGSQEVL